MTLDDVVQMSVSLARLLRARESKGTAPVSWQEQMMRDIRYAGTFSDEELASLEEILRETNDQEAVRNEMARIIANRAMDRVDWETFESKNRLAQSEVWLIHELRTEARHWDEVSQAEVNEVWRVLRMRQEDISIEDEDLRLKAIKANNLAVRLIRSSIERAKAKGAPTIVVRRNLRVPVEWAMNYDVIWNQSDAFLSAVMQNALISNPMAKERKPWKSK